MKQVEFEVFGVPVAKGNLSAFAFKRPNGSVGAKVTDPTKGLKQWAALVRHEAQRHAGGVFFGRDQAVHVILRFALPRPVSLAKKVRHHLKKPDIDKLERTILDALTGTIWQDDAQVVDARCVKRYAAINEPPSVYVNVSELE